jgi:hypothetical protein
LSIVQARVDARTLMPVDSRDSPVGAELAAPAATKELKYARRLR